MKKEVNNKRYGILGRRMNRIVGALCLTLGVLSGCNIMDEEEGFGPVSGGGRTKAKLSVDVAVPSASAVTRGVGFPEDEKTKINSLWLGIYDTKNGDLVGTYRDDDPKSASGTALTMSYESGTYEVRDIEVYYYDSNPEVYIVGVANYKNIQARLVGDGGGFKDLSSLLEGAKNWSDFCRISVDTESADVELGKTAEGYYPLLMGFFNTSRGLTNSTVRPDGSADANCRVRLVGENADRNSNSIAISGAVYLRRLISEFKVSIQGLTPNPNSSPYRVTVSNVKYKIVNTPLEVYLAERPTYKAGASANKEDYLKNTPNSADVAAITGEGKGYAPVPERWIDAAGSPDEGYTFSFRQYENKHWGTEYGYGFKELKCPNWSYEINTEFTPRNHFDESATWVDYLKYWATEGPLDQYLNNSYLPTNNPWYYASLVAERNAHSIREAKWDGDNGAKSGVFKSLVADYDNAYNNYASYIVIQAEVLVEAGSYMTPKKSIVEYIVHEGYSTDSDGSGIDRNYYNVSSLGPVTSRIFDFQCVRNTQYTYNIQINGTDDLYMQTTSSGPYAHNDGLTGMTENINIWKLDGIGSSLSGHDGPPIVDENCILLNENLVFRFYERYSDGTEVNYGTYDPFDEEAYKITCWPDITTQMKSFDECPKSLKEMLVFYVVEPNRGYMANDYYYNNPDNRKYFVTDRMTLYEFREYVKANPTALRDYYCGYNLTRYSVEGEEYDNYNKYERGFYYYEGSVQDADGCTMHTVTGYEQHGLYDPRYKISLSDWNYYPIFNHNYWTEAGSNGNYFWNNYFSNFWSTGLDVVSDDRIELDPYAISYAEDGEDEKYHLITKFEIAIKGFDERFKIDLDQQPQYKLKLEPVNGNPYIYPNYDDIDTEWVMSVPISELIEKYNLTAGTYQVAIIPVGDPEYVQPYEPSDNDYYSLIVHAPKWDFEDPLLPGVTLYNSDYMTYGGLTIVGGTGGGGSGVMLAKSSTDSYVNLQGYGSVDSRDFRLIKFTVQKHGTVKITLSGSGGNLLVGARRPGDTYLRSSVRRPVSGNVRQTVEVDTHELIDDFDDGAKEIVFYSEYSNPSNRYYIYEVEFAVSEDQSSGLDGSEFYYSNSYIESSGSSSGNKLSLIHNYSIYGGLYANFYAVKGSTTYFAFYDTKPRATSYVLGLYNRVNDTQPVWKSSPFLADDCYATTSDSGFKYFVLPLSIPSDADLPTGDYVAKMTPLGDGITYRDGTPHLMLGIYGGQAEHSFVHVIDIPEDWMKDENYSYQNPFYSSSYTFDDKFGRYWDNKGLVLHGSTNGTDDPKTTKGTITGYPNYIQFGGQGYPVDSDPMRGRYLSFSVDEPGTLFLTAGCVADATNRMFKLYKNTGTGVKLISEVAITANNNGRDDYSMVIPESEIDGMTEFFFCADNGGLRLYSMQWSAGNTTGKKMLVTKLAWSMHYGENGKKSHSSSYGWYNTTTPHPVSKYFATDYSFTDNNPVAQSYLFEIYPQYGGDAVLSQILPASEFTLTESDDGRLVSFSFSADLFSPGQYRVAVTPQGDPEVYADCEPQFLKPIEVIDWSEKGYYSNGPSDVYNFMYWSLFNYMAMENAGGSHYLYKGEAVEYKGLAINGSEGAVKTSNQLTPRLGWFDFPGQGYPFASSDGLGTGRNFSITLSTAGEFWLIARPNNSKDTGSLYLYSDENITRPIAQEAMTALTSTRMQDIKVPIVLKTGEVSDSKLFYICPDNACWVFSVFFIPTHSPMYDYWSTHGTDDNMLETMMRMAGEQAIIYQ